MFRKMLAVAILVTLGGTIFAGPFFPRLRCRVPSCSVAPTPSPSVTTPLRASKEEEVPVQQPWLLGSQTDDTCSLQPDTALEPIEGTGSKLPIGLKVPEKITHQVDAETLKKLDALVAALSQKQQPVAISLPVTEETSQRSSRLLMILEWLLYVGGAYFGLSKVGGSLPWVARLVAGLPSALKDASQTPAQTPAATSSTPTKG